MMLDLSLLILAGAVVAQAGEPPPGTNESTPNEIVVTGRRGEIVNKADAVEVLQTFCFDPARRAGSPRAPDSKSHWSPLDAEARQKFGIDDPATSAFGLADEARNHELWLKIEKIKRDDHLDEDRCTLLVMGGNDHRRLIGDLNRLFRGTPTQRHIGEPAGVPALPGWRQWLWTGMPQRGSSNWSSLPSGRRASGSSWIVVTDRVGFYRDHDYIYGDLKIRDGEPLSMISLGVVRKPRR